MLVEGAFVSRSYKYWGRCSYLLPLISTLAMSDSVHDTVVPIPPSQVPTWVKGNQAGTYLNVVLCTLVVYDASGSSFHSSLCLELTFT